MAPTGPRYTIGTKIYTKAVYVTSLSDYSRRYGVNKKNIIIVGALLEVEIGPKTTAFGRRSNFVVVKIDLGGGAMKVATINISSVNIHTLEPLCTSTYGDGGERSDDVATTTTGDTTIIDIFSVKVFEAPAPDPLNDGAFRMVVAQPISKTPVRPLFLLT